MQSTIIKSCISKCEYSTLDSAQLRDRFLLENLFQGGTCSLAYWEVDRAIIGSAVPLEDALSLEVSKELLAADYFCERRELGVINLGGSGSIKTDEQTWALDVCVCLYIGLGTRSIQFRSDDSTNPAKFYLVSYPAHKEYPTALSTQETANKITLGSQEAANVRTIYQHIHPHGVQSCQLVLGYTDVAEGSVWNTMPPHTHLRRSEIYNYFDLTDDNCIMHFMGPPDASRNLVVRNLQPVLSPPWSIHSGVGTACYKFVWAMGGENQQFDDMDGVPLTLLK